jgi:hypothetical protein
MEDFIKALGIANEYTAILNSPDTMKKYNQFGESLLVKGEQVFNEAIPIAIRAYIEYMDKPCTEHPLGTCFVEGSTHMDTKTLKWYYDKRSCCPLCQAKVHRIFGI